MTPAASRNVPLLPASGVLRVIAYSGLVSVITLIYSFHRSISAIILTVVCVFLSILIELYVDPDSIPDVAKSLLNSF